MYSIRDTTFFCRYSPFEEKHQAQTTSFFLIRRSFRSSFPVLFSGGSSIWVLRFSFSKVLDKSFKGVKWHKLFCLRFIRPHVPLVLSYLTVLFFHRSGSCLQVYPFKISSPNFSLISAKDCLLHPINRSNSTICEQVILLILLIATTPLALQSFLLTEVYGFTI